MVRYDRVLVVRNAGAGCFDYLVPPHLSVEIGSVVIAPLVIDVCRHCPRSWGGDIAVEKLRSLEDIAAVPALPDLYCFL